MKKVSPIILALLMLCFFFTACGNHEELKNQGRDQGDVEGLDSRVDFQEVFTKVLDKNCTECHSTYNNYQIVFNQRNQILDAVLTGRMPKFRSPLNNNLKNTLRAWIQNGAPEKAGAISKTIPLGPTYESLLVNVFAPKCLACHSGSTDAPGPPTVNFATYDDIIESNNLYAARFGAGFLDSSDPEGSELIYLVTEADEPMPPLVLPGSPDYVPPAKVTTEEVSALVQWIRNGLPQN